MSLAGLRNRISRAASSVPRALPGATTEASGVFELLLAEGLVLARLEHWASARPGYEPMPAPTVWREPDDADRHMARQCPQLAVLAKKRLVHEPGEHDARLSQLFAKYDSSGEKDEAIETALSAASEKLWAFLDSGKRVPAWAADRVALISTLSATRTEDETPSRHAEGETDQ